MKWPQVKILAHKFTLTSQNISYITLIVSTLVFFIKRKFCLNYSKIIIVIPKNYSCLKRDEPVSKHRHNKVYKSLGCLLDINDKNVNHCISIIQCGESFSFHCITYTKEIPIIKYPYALYHL